MAFTNVWDLAYEALPPAIEELSQGASRIRDLKLDIRERMQADHHWDGDDDDGKHKTITIMERGGDPASGTDEGHLYTKERATITELYYIDSAANVTLLTNAGNVQSFASGTRMLFQQTAAPVGWTKDVSGTINNNALRVVTGSTTIYSGGAGFSSIFTTATPVASATLTTLAVQNGAGSTVVDDVAHVHTIDLDVDYVDVIIADKD